MGSYADRNFLPTSFESSMAEHPEAVQRFMRMTADTRRRVTNQLSQIVLPFHCQPAAADMPSAKR